LTARAQTNSSRPESQPAIRVFIHNYASVPHFVLAAAERQAGHILQGIGIRTEWIECDPRQRPEENNLLCSTALRDSDLVARLVNGAVIESTRPGGEVLGFATLCGEGLTGCWASIDFPALRNVSYVAGSEPDSGQLLGYVLVHEFVHLLLGSREHSAAGIMRARWRKDDLQQIARGGLTFLPGEPAVIRAAVVSRNGAERIQLARAQVQLSLPAVPDELMNKPDESRLSYLSEIESR
jgi:hypothetical protein